MWKFIEQFIYVTVAVITVYVFAYFLGKDVNDVVGWVALGIAAGASSKD